MSMVVHPCWTSDAVGLRLAPVEELNTILAKENQGLVKERLVDPTDLTGGSVVGNRARPRRPLRGIHGYATPIENVNHLAQRRKFPPVRQVAHAVSFWLRSAK